GDLPNLKRFLDGAAVGELTTVYPILSPVCWTSAVTGVNPGKHGIYDFQKADPAGGTEPLIETATFRRTLPIWMLLSESGYRVGILNVPMTYPPDPVRGVMVSGFPYPSGNVNFTYPPELQDKLGKYPLDYLGLTLFTRTQLDILNDIKEGQEARARVAKEWVTSGKYDFIWAVFTDPDRVQHFFWKDMDPHHPRHTAEGAKLFGKAIHDIWVRDDQILGELLDALPEDATVMLLSDHGMDAIYRQVNLANWLPRTEMPQWLRTDAIPKLLITNGLVHHWVTGRVPGAADREVFLDKFIALCQGLVDPATGVHPFESLFRREDIYAGRLVEKAPDLVFQESPKYYVTKGNPDSTAFPDIQDLWSTSFSGHHRPEGILALRSPAVQVSTQGTLRDRLAGGGDFKRAHIVDVAPTLLALMAEMVPEDMDGRVLEEVITPDFLSQHPVRVGPVEGFLLDALPPSKLTPEEREKLKALPYLQ
ncbi:MAG TPA: alkaline phosphatase family protein, partial [Candidatus Eisenbacteria bacterium]|nr:alkaline phosphatase family protein [Candidatus Eisenbacteria bacterium]